MESWHNSKMSKYSPLKTVIELNGWCVDLFPVEVGARGYCSKTVSFCLKRIGFNNRLIKSTIKKLSKLSMESSFCIWLARNNKAWTESSLKSTGKDFLNDNQFSPPMNSPVKDLKSSTLNSKIKSSALDPIGFINKGNTCYANSILQVLSVLPSLWNRAPSESNYISPMLKAITLNMAVKQRSTHPVDPSNFLWALRRNLSTTAVPFDFNCQQDVAEILQVVLDEVKGTSLAARDLISTTQQTTVFCNKCLCSTMSEETLDILPLPVLSDIQTSLNTFLSPETLSSQNKWFCPSCNTLSESTKETQIICSPPILIIQLRRFSNQGSSLIKNEDLFKCILDDPTKHFTFL